MDVYDLYNMDESVGAVADFLDRDEPGWAEVLVQHYGSDLAGLYISDGRACVFSAVYGRYTIGIDRYVEIEGSAAYNAHSLVVNALSQDVYLRDSWLRAVNQRLGV